MRFVDEVKIVVRSGDGGRGAVSFRREKYVPKGGPDGGDGGKGGDVVLEVDASLRTLYDFTHRRFFEASHGRPGSGQQKTGAQGEELIVAVPLGTLVYDDQDGRLLADLVKPGQRLIAAAGGRGGKGNKHFAGPTRRTPRFAQPGEPGQERRLRLELKLLADVALIGLPNAGKSTLIRRISAARPKVAEYPFTTLEPNLGVVEAAGRRPFVVADVPGLIQGASQGVGLGHRFLRHVERTRLLVFVLDVTQDLSGAWRTLKKEIEAFSPRLARQEQVIALNKIDLLAAGPAEDEAGWLEKGPVFYISALTGQGVDGLIEALGQRLEKLLSGEAVDGRAA